MGPEHVVGAVRVMTEAIPDVRCSREKVLAWVGDPQRMPFVAVDDRASDPDGRVVGFARVQRLVDGREFEEFRKDAAYYGVEAAWPDGTDLASLVGNAVSAARQGEGIGTMLLHERLRYLRDEHGVTHVTAVSWAHGRGHTSGGLLRSVGMVPVAERAGWADDSGEFLCRWCLPAVCSCRTVLYVGSVSRLPFPEIRRLT